MALDEHVETVIRRYDCPGLCDGKVLLFAEKSQDQVNIRMSCIQKTLDGDDEVCVPMDIDQLRRLYRAAASCLRWLDGLDEDGGIDGD